MPRKAWLVAVEFKATHKTPGTYLRTDSRPTPAEESLEELAELVRSRGDEVIGQTIQARKQPDGRYFIGSGKLRELAVLVEETGAEVVVFDHELSPVQVRNLEEALDRPVLDRAAVILEIFAGRAHSREGKLQVELARLKYLLPRLTGKGTSLSRLGGGIGTRGPGEKELEFERRRLKARIRELEVRIEAIKQHRGLVRKQRVRNRVPVVALVGYTNAGKSTLLKALTGEEAYIDNRLFATLDPQARGFRTPCGTEVVLTDTVGFIRKLPHQLVAAFRATLEEVLFADLLVHVVDVSRPGIERRIEAVEEVLREIGAANHPTLMVFNKVDLLPAGEVDRLRVEYDGILFISARQHLGLAELKDAIDDMVGRPREAVRFLIPYHRGDLLGYLHERALVLVRENRPDGIGVEVWCDQETINHLKPYMEGETGQ